MRASFYALVTIALLSACSSGDAPASGDPATSGASASAAVSGQIRARAVSSSDASSSTPGEVSAYSREQTNDIYAFTYQFPAVAPQLAAILKREAKSAEARLKADAEEARQQSRDNNFPYFPYEVQHVWQQVAAIPRFQSLSAEIYSFSGGAHGNTGYDALVWDRQTKMDLKPIDLFTSRAALDAVIQQAFCKKLDLERAEKRGHPAENSHDMFNSCIDPLGQTLILGSSNGKTFNRLGIIVSPYAAGPYVEGTYDITLPVTQPVLEQVKPAYKNYFSVMR